MRCARALAALGLVACAGGALLPARFSTDWTDDGGASIGRVWDRVGASDIPRSVDLVVGVVGLDRMIGVPLGGGPRWTFTHALEARPVLTGTVVVGAGGGEVFALDARTGHLAWRRPTGGIPLLGAGDDGLVTVMTFKRAGGVGSTLLAVAHDGQVVQQIETDKLLGVPAVVGRLAFVPWSGQYVSVVDLSTGNEAARVTLREETTRAWTQGGSLWFGQTSIVRFDGHIRGASRGQATRVVIPQRELAGTPHLMWPGSEPVPAPAGATDKVRLYALPEGTSQGADLADGRWYATYFRLAMGFGSGQGKLAWVHTHATDLIGGSAAPGALVLCDDKGKVTTLDAKSGAVLGTTDVGEPLRACVVNVESAAPVGPTPQAAPLAEQLAAAVEIDDPQLVVAQKLLLTELTRFEDETATRTLVELASDPRTSPDLLPQARTALAARRNGAAIMQAALGRHYDFLHDVLRPPPVGPMAQALGAMKATSAAPALATHLFDPADTDDDVRQVGAALAIIAGPAELPALRQFFAMYRARAADEDTAAAAASVGEALLRLGDAELVAGASKDEQTVPLIKERLDAALAARPSTPPAPASPSAPAQPNKK